MSWLLPWQWEQHSLLSFCSALLPAFALQDALPVVGPGEQPPARRLQLEVPVVAAGEEDVLPARVLLRACGGKGAKLGSAGGLPPQPTASAAKAFQTSNGILVIKQQVSRYDGFIPG